jgi:hypothetical protein
MIKKVIALIAILQAFFMILFGWVFVFYKDLGLSLFLVFCVTIPLFCCHVLSGYIAVRMKFSHRRSALLLANFPFVWAIVKSLAGSCEWKDKGIYFLTLYALSLVNTLIAFVVRLGY